MVDQGQEKSQPETLQTWLEANREVLVKIVEEIIGERKEIPSVFFHIILQRAR